MEKNEVSIKEYIDQRFSDLDKFIAAKFSSSEKAVDKAEISAEQWRNQANEWRQTMNDKDKNFALKADTERIRDDVRNLQLSEAKLAGKASQSSVMWALLFSVVGTLIGLIGIALAIYK